MTIRPYLTLIALGLAACALHAQEPALTAPDAPQGMFVPVLTDDQMKQQPAKGQGELVYNKTARSFYYFDDGKWLPLLTAEPGDDGKGIHWVAQRVDKGGGEPKITDGPTGYWDLTGNSSTIGTNFLGTTDANSLRLKVNNNPSGIVSHTMGGPLGFGLNSGASGNNNTFLGSHAGQQITTGAGNTYVGNTAGRQTTTGGENTIVGYYAGQGTTTGGSNVFVGSQAGQQNSSGNANVIIGLMAGKFANGNTNTFIGTSAGGATDTGGNNVFIGNNGGAGNTSGSNNVTVGANASLGAFDLNNASAIGRGSRVDINDAMVLGAVNGINGMTTTTKVGIGTNAPAERLHVVGKIRVMDGSEGIGRVLTSDANGTGSWTALPTPSNDWTLLGNAGTSPLTNFIGTTDAVDFRIRTSNTARLSVTSAGNVGINTTAPADRLHVAGNIRMVDGTQALGRVLTSDANGRGTWQALPAQSRDWTVTGNAGLNATINFIGTTDAVDVRFRTNNTERMAITSAGKVGIGTNSPAASLQVNGAVVVQPSPVILLGGAFTNVFVGDRSLVRLGNFIAGSSVLLSDGLSVGQLLVIQNAGVGGGALSFDIVDNPATSNCELVANRTLGLRDAITLIWDGTDWIEVSFAAN